MLELPKIISVDDHVVEPPHVWQTYLPQRFREKGPRVEREKWGPFVHKPGARYRNTVDPDGKEGDFWIFEDEVIYVHKSFVAIPLSATPDGDVKNFDRTVMQMVPITYDEMRPGCFDREARIEDFDLNWVDGSLPFPTFPRFCGQTFLEAKDHELGLACVQAYNDWMVEEWCEPSRGYNIPLCIMPLWDAGLAAAEIERMAAKGVHAFCFSEIPTRLKLPSIHSGEWDPMFAAADANDIVLCMHVGSSSTMPAASPDSPEAVGGTVAFNNVMASMADWLFSGNLIRFPNIKLAYSEGQIGWIPYALERADTVWEHHNPWMHTKDRIPELPSSYYWGRIFGCFTADRHGLANIDACGEDNICFETDYPHTDTTWPHSKEYAEKMIDGITEEQAYKVLRGNAIKMLSLDRT
ncbi:MAG: amidohydrolase [Actinobacteria bacterium]|nr:amidohydrolase [Actinomycetota bacterium]